MNSTLTESQSQEFQSVLTEYKSGLAKIQDLRSNLTTIQTDNARLTQLVADLRRSLVSRGSVPVPRYPGQVSDDCARFICSHFIQLCEKTGRIEALCSLPAQRDALIAASRETLGLAAPGLDPVTRNALTTSEIPLPTQYAGELRELISEFGVIRRRMLHYPIGMGTARPARMGTRPAFGPIAMSAAFPELSPSITFASLESHKVGGIVRLPREIDEQSIVPMGHFLARYAAIEFARLEDNWGFLADGDTDFENVKGIVQLARDEGHTVTLATGKTKPSDATLADFRALRRQVNKAALSGRLSAYYLDTTWESALPGFRTQQEPNVYQRLPDGTAILDGYPIVWTDILTPYGTTAAADKPLAVFGALSFWWFGEHGSPRIDNSAQVFFANDQLAIRFIEEIDLDYAAADATAALLTAAT